MSYYYAYYAGYLDTVTNKIYPLGPFDCFGNIHPIICKPRTFASDLHESFSSITKDMTSSKLINCLGYKSSNYEPSISFNEDDNDEIEVMLNDVFEGKWLPYSKLPEGSFIKEGYFLIDDIEKYRSGEYSAYDLFDDYLTIETYAAKLGAEVKTGFKKSADDEFHSCMDYSYFAYPDTNSREFECYLIHQAIDILDDFNLPKNSELVVIEVEG